MKKGRAEVIVQNAEYKEQSDEGGEVTRQKPGRRRQNRGAE